MLGVEFGKMSALLKYIFRTPRKFFRSRIDDRPLRRSLGSRKPRRSGVGLP
jgi:hypothetical protein